MSNLHLSLAPQQNVSTRVPPTLPQKDPKAFGSALTLLFQQIEENKENMDPKTHVEEKHPQYDVKKETR